VATIKKHKTGEMVAELQARCPIHVIAIYERVAEKDATHKGTDGTPMKLRIWASCPNNDFVQSELLRKIAGVIQKCGEKSAAKRG